MSAGLAPGSHSYGTGLRAPAARAPAGLAARGSADRQLSAGTLGLQQRAVCKLHALGNKLTHSVSIKLWIQKVIFDELHLEKKQ